MPFVGTHDHTLDSKGRLVLPSKFRSHFTDGAYLSPWAGCVALWTTERFTEMVGRIAEEIRAGDTDSDVQRALGANSEMVRPDAQGRIMVPPRLRDFAALERDVVICGAIDRIEIWNPTRWASVAPELNRSLVDAFLQGGGI